MAKIERSNQAGKFTPEEIREHLAETKRRQSQPGYAEREARRLRDIKATLPKTKFPELAKRGTRPTVTGPQSTNPLDVRRRLADKLGNI